MILCLHPKYSLSAPDQNYKKKMFGSILNGRSVGVTHWLASHELWANFQNTNPYWAVPGSSGIHSPCLVKTSLKTSESKGKPPPPHTHTDLLNILGWCSGLRYQ